MLPILETLSRIIFFLTAAKRLRKPRDSSGRPRPGLTQVIDRARRNALHLRTISLQSERIPMTGETQASKVAAKWIALACIFLKAS